MQFLDIWMARFYAWLMPPQPIAIRVVREENDIEHQRDRP